MGKRAVCRLALIVMLCGLGSVGSAEGAGFATVGHWPAWEYLFTGTRSESMGQADLAASRGPFAVFDNPSPLLAGGLDGAEQVQAAFGHLGYFPDLDLYTTGVSYEPGNFRIGVARHDLRGDEREARTAYLPVGTGRMYRPDERVLVVAACVDIARALVPRSAWEWTVGLGYRRYRFGTFGEPVHAWCMDLGTSARYEHALGDVRLGAAVAGTIGNFGNRDEAPRSGRSGLALTLALDANGRADAVAVTAAVAWADDRFDSDYVGSSHLGLELVLWQVLSARLGHDDRTFGGTSQYGFGLRLPKRWLAPFGLEVDWGALDLGEAAPGGVDGRMVSVAGTLAI
jgi:hypothetical protein